MLCIFIWLYDLCVVDMHLEIKKIKATVSALERTVSIQKIIIQEQAQTMQKQSMEIAALKQELNELNKHNKGLKEKLQKKNSANSSIAPSKDENRPKRNQSLRRSSGKKTGGQKGHKGDTLKMSESPDITIEHIPSYCRKCGNKLDQEALFLQRRQVIDIPPIVPVITEHQVYSRMCSCGHCTISDFPKEAQAPVSYGNNIEALIAYLSVRQYIPINRIQEFLAQITNLKISQGSICNKLQSFADKCAPIYTEIKSKIETSDCLGTDETGFVLNGKKGWMWTWQTPKLTYIAASSNRGIQTIKENFAKGFPLATLVHDCWKPHFNIPAKNHQLCIAHLRRDLNFFIEQRKECWSYKFERLLRKALKLKSKILDNPSKNYEQQIQQIQKSADKLLDADVNADHQKIMAFKKRIIKYKDYLFQFLWQANVPPDNNGSERAIRNVKVKQKVSGQFKTMEGANQFAIIRSVLDTCIKNNANIFSTLANIHILQPE